MTEHPARAGLVVDLLAGFRHLLVGQEPVLLDIGRSGRNQRNLGVAVEKHLLFVVVELEVLDGLFVVAELLVPAGLADRVAHVDKAHDAGVVAQKMRVHVHDKLVFQRTGALLRHRGRSGFGLGHVEQRAIDFVHRDERCGHSGSGLKEAAAIEALFAAEIVGHRQQPRFDLALPFVLRVRIEFVTRNDLRRNRSVIGAQFGRHQCGKFGFRQLAAHDFPLGCGWFWETIDLQPTTVSQNSA